MSLADFNDSEMDFHVDDNEGYELGSGCKSKSES